MAAFSSGMKLLLEVVEVLVHVELLVAADETAHRVDAEQHGGVHDAHHEVVLLLPARPGRRASMLSK